MLWRVFPPKGSSWVQVNSIAGVDHLVELTKKHHDKRVVIPHRRNRLVMFDSQLVHASDSFTFKPGYVPHYAWSCPPDGRGFANPSCWC